MYTDLYHVLPCDYEANEARWNYPYGEVKTENWSNGYCKRGTMTVSGFNGVVFEPNDEIKGDIARIYFYMATRYEHESMSIWGNAGSNALLYNKYPFYKTWLVNILLKWHENDPVSEREIKRNNAVEKLQGNRNPFVDYPELVEYIWGGTTADKDKTDKKFFYINTAAGKEIEYIY